MRLLRKGSIEVICGSMFSGKTEELIRRLKRAEIAKMSVSIYKPKLDYRYNLRYIVSHNKIKMKSHSVAQSQHILKLAINDDVVGIDEGQFFDKGITKVCRELAKLGKRVVIAGLDKDFKGMPFTPMPSIMCEADYLDKLTAICVICGNPATYSQRLSKDSSKVLIGELDKYEARCRTCFEIPKKDTK